MNADQLQIIKDELSHLDPTMAGDEDAEDFRAAVLVFAAACFGADVDDLAAFTGYPTDFVASVSQRMRSCGLQGEGVCERRLVRRGRCRGSNQSSGFLARRSCCIGPRDGCRT